MKFHLLCVHVLCYSVILFFLSHHPAIHLLVNFIKATSKNTDSFNGIIWNPFSKKRMMGVPIVICDTLRRPPMRGPLSPPSKENTPRPRQAHAKPNQRHRHGRPPPQTTVESNKQAHERNGGTAPPTTAETYTQAHERRATTTPPHPPKAWERFADDTYSILKRTHPEILFHHINNL